MFKHKYIVEYNSAVLTIAVTRSCSNCCHTVQTVTAMVDRE